MGGRRMNEKKSNQLIGIIILALGIVLALKSIFSFTSWILFDGWWAVIIVGIAIYNMIRNGVTKKNTVAAVVGAVLFINCRTNFLGVIFGKLIIPIILLAIGFRFLQKNR